MTKKSGFFILDGADVIGMIDSGGIRPPNCLKDDEESQGRAEEIITLHESRYSNY
ncbi:MAG: hypothetical protein Q8O43_08100 [Dehalococcoidia bacterium]|nr:hypothetical protein [Dehalococcoidia bacterium]